MSCFKAVATIRSEPPPYGARSGFVPRTINDFGDGGAFPEIHVAQFPLGRVKFHFFVIILHNS